MLPAESEFQSTRVIRGPKTSAAAFALRELMMAKPRLSLAAAESLTCGRVQARVGEISGASNFFLGGITAYTLEEKVRHLGVERATARRVNSVSAAVAEQMARGVCELFDSEVGVATTGYAEPSLADGVTEPFAWWALAHRSTSARRRKARDGHLIALRSGWVECPGANRVDAQSMVADAVVAELIAYLRELRKAE